MKHIKNFNEAKKPIQKTVTRLDYHDMMAYLEEKYQFNSRGFSGIPSTMDVDRHFYQWCDKHNLGKKDSKGKDRGSSQEFYKMYKEAPDGDIEKPPYMDFWHYLCDCNEPHNESFIYIPRKVDDSKEMTTGKRMEMYQSMLKDELKSKRPDKSHIKVLKDLIAIEEEKEKNPKQDPWKNWKQDITDLIFKEFGEYAEDDDLRVWVEW